MARAGFGRQVAALASLILALGLLVAAMLDPRVASGSARTVHACVIPVQEVEAKPLGGNGSVDGFTLLYYKCGMSGCGRNLSEAPIPPNGSRLKLGPSLIHLPLAYRDGANYPPTELRALQPGVLEAYWSYPDLKVGLLLVVNSTRALMLVESDLAGKARIVSVEGCYTEEIASSDDYTIYNLTCSYNIAATSRVKAELITSHLHGLLLTLNPRQALACRAQATEVLLLRLPLLAASTLFIALAVALTYSRR